MALRADIELEAGAKTVATGLLMDLIATLRSMRPGDVMAVISSNRMLGAELEAWCRFTRNTLVDVGIEQDHHRWVIRCGSSAGRNRSRDAGRSVAHPGLSPLAVHEFRLQFAM